jgi:hypothetical protein
MSALTIGFIERIVICFMTNAVIWAGPLIYIGHSYGIIWAGPLIYIGHSYGIIWAGPLIYIGLSYGII